MFHADRILGAENVRKHLEALRKGGVLGSWNVVFFSEYPDTFLLFWEEIEP